MGLWGLISPGPCETAAGAVLPAASVRNALLDHLHMVLSPQKNIVSQKLLTRSFPGLQFLPNVIFICELQYSCCIRGCANTSSLTAGCASIDVLSARYCYVEVLPWCNQSENDGAWDPIMLTILGLAGSEAEHRTADSLVSVITGTNLFTENK